MIPYIDDFKFGVRQFGKNPGSMVLAILAYALGLGLVGFMLTMIFGVVRAHPENVDFETVQVVSWDTTTEHLWKNGSQTREVRYSDFKDIQAEQEVFEAFAAAQDDNFNIVIGNFAKRFLGTRVTSEFFDVLNTSPHLGNFFEKGDDTPNSATKAVISHRLWTNELGGKESILGQSLTINGVPTTVIGIAQEGFDFPAQKDIWINENKDYLSQGRTEGGIYTVLGSLKKDQSPANALTSLNTIAMRLESDYPETNTGYISIELRRLSDLILGNENSNMMYLMFACSILVLLIACTNIANLTLSRATTRARELAIRSALGGRRGRLIMQMIVEGLSIAFFGGVGGLIMAIWTSKLFWSWMIASTDNDNIPSFMNMDVNIQVIVSLSIITLLASVVASIVPAIKSSNADVNVILKDNSRGATGMRMGLFIKGLTLLQLCVSCSMLIATASMVSNARDNAVFEPYYDPESMMVARFDLPENYYAGDQRAEGLIRLQNLLENNPTLEGVGFTSAFDMLFNWGSRWEIRGMKDISDDGFTQGRHEIVSDNFFELLNIPILYGRGFEALDRGANAEQVCVINEILAERIWPGSPQEAIGKQIRDVWTATNPWITIIGIVPDTKMAGPGARSADQLGGVYRPMSSAPQDSITIFAKTKDNPLVQANQIRSILHSEDQSIALYRIKKVEKAIEDANFGPLFLRNVFGMFGIAALVLASIGVYGVMDFSIRQRFKEYAIRQALGAKKIAIMNHVFKLGRIQIGVGLILGVALGWAIIVILGHIFGGNFLIETFNFVIPVLIVSSISFIALYTPARYVTNANLANCLRDE